MSKYREKRKNIPELISMIKKGDSKALNELIRRVQKDVFTTFSYLTEKRHDVADLTQETLLKMAKNIYYLKDTKNFKSWLNQISINTYYDYLKKFNKDSLMDFDENKLLEIKDKIGCEPGEKCLFSEMEKLIRAAILSLPNDLRIVVILREYEGLSYNEIARITNSAVGTVKSRISRAREKLQNELKEFI